MSIYEHLTESEKREVYEQKQREYFIEDAESQYREWSESHSDITQYSSLTKQDFTLLAERYDREHDCNIADNVQWQNLIFHYMKENNIIYPDLNL